MMSNEIQNTENPMENVQSHDWNRERLEQLKKLMPDLFTNDGELNVNELKKVVDPKSVNETERYEFRWFGKSNAKREAFTPTDATLVYDEARSVNPTESENLIIEGENLAVLKLLSNSYREQIKCIYIDPPYNTGKDFVYSDSWKQDKAEYWEDAETTENGYKIDTNAETDGRFHSNWLNMMYSRLLIARQLLREDGVMFISIDDNEVHHLRKLCDEVFGEENFIAQLIWKKKQGGGNDSKNVIVEHEYVLLYSKNAELCNLNIDKKYELDDKLYPFKDENGEYGLITLDKSSIQFSESLVFEITDNDGNVYLPRVVKGKQSCWRWGRQKVDNDFDKLVFKNGKVYTKYYRPDGITAKSLLVDTRFGRTESGQDDIKKMFNNDAPFSYPKPISLIQHLYEISTNPNDLILDFFAGSGTTGQAITELNQEGASTGSAQVGNRKYILVQLPEQTNEKSEAYKAGYKKISDITIERNKRVIEKIIKKKKDTTPDLFSKKESEQEPLKGLGFKVFKLQKSNFPRVEFAPDPEKTSAENIELLKKYIKDKEAQLVSAFNKDELITEILIKNGFKLNYTLTKQEEFKKNEILFATDGDKETLICLDVLIADETVEHFKTHTEQKLIVLERAIDTTKKWHLKHYMGDKFNPF